MVKVKKIDYNSSHQEEFGKKDRCKNSFDLQIKHENNLYIVAKYTSIKWNIIYFTFIPFRCQLYVFMCHFTNSRN